MPDILNPLGLLYDPHQMRNLRDHAPRLGSINNFTCRVELVEAQSLYHEFLTHIETYCAAEVLNFERAVRRGFFVLCHMTTPESLREFSRATGLRPADLSSCEVPQTSP